MLYEVITIADNANGIGEMSWSGREDEETKVAQQIMADLAVGEDMVAVLECVRRASLAVAEKSGTDLRRLVLDPEVEVPGGGPREIGDFALDPEPADAPLEQGPDLAVQLADRDRGRLTRVFHGREYSRSVQASAEKSRGVQLHVYLHP